MNDAPNRARGLSRIDLGREAPFSLGAALVHPATCEVRSGAERIRLQPRVMQVLVALARAQGEAVSRDDLVESCWGGLAVGEDAINRCIQRLRRLEKEAPDAFAIETLPRIGYRLTASSRAGAIAPASSPIIELRPCDRDRPSAEQTGPSPRPEDALRAAMARSRAGRLIATIAVLSLVLLGGLWLWRGRPFQTPRAVFPRVAVTAFQPADGTPEASAVAATLTGEVSDAASSYDLTVVKPPAMKGLDSTPAADFLLNGRLLRKGNQLSATSELVDASQGVVVYAFDTPLTTSAPSGAASIIAARVAHALDPSKLTNDLGGKLSASDYTLVARANEAIDQGDFPEVLGLTQALAERHPDDGDLQASIVIAALIDAQSAPSVDRPELVRLAHRSEAKAERLNPNSGLLHVAKEYFLVGPMSYAQQERETRKAIELQPNLHVAYDGLGGVMVSVGRSREGIGLTRRMIELDPMSKVVVGGAVLRFVQAGDKDEALGALSRFETLWPEDRFSKWGRTWVALNFGERKEFLDAEAKNPEAASGSLPAEAKALLGAAATHDPASVRTMVDQCFANHGGGSGPADATCLVEMVQDGALDDAFRFAKLTYPDHRKLYPLGADGWLLAPPADLDPAWLFTPRMKPFRDDPRFWDVAARAGLVDYWLSTGVWPDICAGRSPDCRRLAAAAQARAPAASS